jgi:hypothetical protein
MLFYIIWNNKQYHKMLTFECVTTSVKNNLEIFFFSYKFCQIISQSNKCFYGYYLNENNFKITYMK